MADGGDGGEGDDDGDGKSDKTRCPQHAHLGLFKLRCKVRQVSRSPGRQPTEPRAARHRSRRSALLLHFPPLVLL